MNINMDKLTKQKKLKLYKYIHKKIWNMNTKEMEEMEEEFGEDGLIDCINEILQPLAIMDKVVLIEPDTFIRVPTIN